LLLERTMVSIIGELLFDHCLRENISKRSNGKNC
jgi:hypothetical protein